MDNSEESPYLTVLNDGLHNFLLQPTEEVLDVQDPNLKGRSIFTEIEDVAKEWSVGLPALMDDNAIASTLALPSNLPHIYEEELANPRNMVLETAPNEEITVKTEIAYPIEVPGKGFIISEGVFITYDLLLQLNFGNNEDLNILNEDTCEADNEQVVVPVVNPSVVNQSRLIITKRLPQETLLKKQMPLNNVQMSTNTPLANSNLIVTKNLHKDPANCDSWFEVVSAHKCKQCGFLSDQRDIIIQHYKIKHMDEGVPINGQLKENGSLQIKSIYRNGKNQTIYICSVCKLGYGSTEKLKMHMILSHKLVNIPEELEPKETANNVTKNRNSSKSPIKHEDRKKMQLSLLRQQSKHFKKIKCSVSGCDLRFALDQMRARHEKSHIEGQKQFKCSECDQKFSLWRMCSQHLWRCHGLDLGLLTCPMCNEYKAASTVRLVNHMAIHEEEKPYSCQICSKRFKQHSQMINHQVVHKDSNLPEWASQQQCEICKKYFSNSKSLKKHIQGVHDKFKPFICSVCGHKTARKSMLELHLRQHTGEKPHQCQICEYKTGDHNSLRRHLMRHSGNMKYSCPHCEYQSIQSTAYKNHIATKHPGLGGSYYCVLCSYHTVNENTYTAHLGDHEKGLIKETPEHDNADESYKTLSSSLVDKNHSSGEQNEQVIYDIEDDESHNYLLLLEHSNDAVDTGGITIPAGFEMSQ